MLRDALIFAAGMVHGAAAVFAWVLSSRFLGDHSGTQRPAKRRAAQAAGTNGRPPGDAV